MKARCRPSKESQLRETKEMRVRKENMEENRVRQSKKEEMLGNYPVLMTYQFIEQSQGEQGEQVEQGGNGQTGQGE